MPEADGAALRRGRRRVDRAGEGRGPARLRRSRRPDRTRGRAGIGAVGVSRARSSGSGASTRRGDLATFIAIAATNDTDVNIRVYDDAERAGDARQRRRRPAAVQLHPPRRSCARGRWRSRSRPPVPHRRWPSASRRRSRKELRRALRAARGALERGPRVGLRARWPTYQDRKAFFEGIVNGQPGPDRAAALRGDETAVRELIAVRPAARTGPPPLPARRRAAPLPFLRDSPAFLIPFRPPPPPPPIPRTASSSAPPSSPSPPPSRAVRTRTCRALKLAAAAENAGCEVVAMEVVPDDAALIEDRLRHYVDAGIRAGVHDRRDRADAERHHA